jgi:uncharacterized protein (TIGR03086 family)
MVGGSGQAADMTDTTTSSTGPRAGLPPAAAVRAAADLAAAAVAAVPAGAWSAPTPCRDYDLRTLVDHLAWGTVLSQRAATRIPLERDWSSPEPPPFLAGREPGEWAAALAPELDAAADAWADPAAWEGETVMGSAPMPASVVGPMMTAEFVMHGWDVARAVGAPFDVPAALGEAVLEAVLPLAGMGRDGGWYGPEVAVPDDAPAFERALGLAGRDPAWRPPA